MLTHTIRICIIGMATKARHCSDFLRPRVPRKPALALFSVSLRNVWAEMSGEFLRSRPTAGERFEVGNVRCLAHSEWWFRMIAIRTSQHSAGAFHPRPLMADTPRSPGTTNATDVLDCASIGEHDACEDRPFLIELLRSWSVPVRKECARERPFAS